ncbi:hypothetical protein [Altibacter sp.]|uniref:hypothetical protein n=1 Tax=Altibacter sp. TaxID=2024823 RepID=UPI002584758B|nr:hypothetical protein [Altibacter sp.]MCW8899069.1 hypothetical protein [Gammaproteobacteria bacterium]MCW8986931.1 hypothetical protein [Gammaproteobacteria bacterium]MCW9038352.1 hypothetical protein [Altibacter sp.]
MNTAANKTSKNLSTDRCNSAKSSNEKESGSIDPRLLPFLDAVAEVLAEDYLLNTTKH